MGLWIGKRSWVFGFGMMAGNICLLLERTFFSVLLLFASPLALQDSYSIVLQGTLGIGHSIVAGRIVLGHSTVVDHTAQGTVPVGTLGIDSMQVEEYSLAVEEEAPDFAVEDYNLDSSAVDNSVEASAAV
jgi:hypothetical protein